MLWGSSLPFTEVEKHTVAQRGGCGLVDAAVVGVAAKYQQSGTRQSEWNELGIPPAVKADVGTLSKTRKRPSGGK